MSTEQQERAAVASLAHATAHEVVALQEARDTMRKNPDRMLAIIDKMISDRQDRLLLIGTGGGHA